MTYEMDPIRIPVGVEPSPYRRKPKPKAPTYKGQTLRQNMAGLKSPMAWGNPGEHGVIHMEQIDMAIKVTPTG